MKILFSSITYGPTEPKANRTARGAIMYAGNHGHQVIGDISPDKIKWDVARNQVAHDAIEQFGDEADAIFWCDSDVTLPVYTIARLADRGVDFITGLYFQREPPHWPLVTHFNGKAFNWIMKWPENVIAPIDGCGFGCVLTSMKLLKAMGNDWFKYEKYSEDFDFCLRAKRLGFPLYMDTGILCGHLREPQEATFEDFKRCHPKFYPEEEQTYGSVRSSVA